MDEKSLNEKFDDKIKKLKEELPALRVGVNCAELTLTNVLDVLGIDNYLLHNVIIPLAGGLGGYKSKKGWQGACGAVCGGCAAIGVIMGGHERMSNDMIPLAYLQSLKFATEFEKEFGSVVCSQLCEYDFSEPDGFIEYQKSNAWGKTCYKFVVWAVNQVRKQTRRDLKKKWE